MKRAFPVLVPTHGGVKEEAPVAMTIFSASSIFIFPSSMDTVTCFPAVQFRASHKHINFVFFHQESNAFRQAFGYFPAALHRALNNPVSDYQMKCRILLPVLGAYMPGPHSLTRAFEGIHPTFRHTPPSHCLSTIAVFNPFCDARIAHTYPPGPAPITTTSYFFIISPA